MPQPPSPPLLDTITKIGKAEAVACIRADAYHEARVARRAAPDTIAVKPLRSRIPFQRAAADRKVPGERDSCADATYRPPLALNVAPVM